MNNLCRNSPTNWSNTLKQFVRNSRRIVRKCVDHFVGLAVKGLIQYGHADVKMLLIMRNFKFQDYQERKL